MLLKTNVITKPLLECNITHLESDQGNRPAIRDGLKVGQYCAYDPEGKKDSCEGDSGGPLQYYPRGEKEISSIVGVVSFGIVCGSTLPAVYTRVAHYINWIEPIVWPNGEITRPRVYTPENSFF